MTHQLGRPHGDVRPQNLWLDQSGITKLLVDPEVVLQPLNQVNPDEQQRILSRADYMAPELAQPGVAPNGVTDIYALGCILYEMLIGEKLFPGETPPAAMMAHFRVLTLPDTWPEGVPSGVADVLANALAPKAADRYATAGEMAQALAALTALGTR